MLKDLIIVKLQEMGREYTLRPPEISTQCLNPEHVDRHPSFSINYLTGAFNCFSCGFKGNFVRYLELDEETEKQIGLSEQLECLRRLTEELEIEEEHKVVIMPPRASIELPSFRGLSKELIDAQGLYYCNLGRYRGRIIFPMDNAFDARIYPLDSTAPQVPDAKYLRPVSFKTAQRLYVVKVNDSPTVVICEGVMDALSYAELGFNAAANFGLAPCTPGKAGELLAHGFSEVTNGFDRDEKGMAGWQKIKESFRYYFTIGRPLEVMSNLGPGRDINDYLIEIKGDK